MYSVYANAEVMSKGFECLFDILGPMDAERFIAALSNDSFDYTKWQREYFDKMNADELLSAALTYDEKHPIAASRK